jgi:mRNA interferase HigB
MQVLSRRALREFWEQYPHAETPLRAWYQIVTAAKWKSFAEVKASFGTADAVGDKRIIFDIGGNNYRIVARVVYDPFYRVMVKFVGTHEEYDQINSETV